MSNPKNINPTNIFELHCGHKIQLVELNQSLTYEGLFGGRPNAASNARLIERALERAVRPHRDEPPYLIKPMQTEIEMSEREKAQEGEYPSPFGPPQFLPGVLCVGRFESMEIAEDLEVAEEGNQDFDNVEASEPFEESEPRWLVVVWFQDEFALPIDGNVRQAVQKLDWDAVAHGGGGLDWL